MLVWMVFASALVAMAFWQAQVTVAQEAAARNKALPPPVRTRHAIRPPPVAFTGDPVADYIARCEKGLTDQEIGWILEDFHNAGLDLDIMGMSHSDDEYAPLRTAQHHWYHDALVDGLRLNPSQSDQVAANLFKLFVAAKSTFDKAVLEGLPSSEMRGVETYARFAEPLIWIIGGGDLENFYIREPYQPWNLCTLTSAQQDITWKKSADAPKSSVSPPSPLQPRFQNSMPFGTAGTGGRVPGFFEEVDSLLPILTLQKLAVAENPFDEFGELIPNIRHLHPAQ